MDLISELLAPLTVSEFTARHLCKAPFSSPGAAKALAERITWDIVREILESGHDNCWLPERGRLLEGATGRLSYSEAREGYAKGRTLLLRHTDKVHPLFAPIGKIFAETFGKPVDVQLYVTPENREGFDWHYDIEEVFVLQCGGQKEFLLRANTVNPRPTLKNIPTDLGFGREQATEQLRCRLHAGDFLYIPSGYWHRARALEEASFHLSVGLMFSPDFV